MPVIFENPQLIIRTFVPEEEDWFVTLLGDEQVKEHLPKRTVEQNREIFRKIIQANAENALLNNWAIVNKADNKLAGFGLVRHSPADQTQIELGYCLDIPYWGKGIATAFINAMKAYIQEQIGQKTLVAVTTLGNIASQKALEKTGFIRQENTLKDGTEIAIFKLASPEV